MQRFDEHPTWRMLEESKNAFRDQINIMPTWNHDRFVIEELLHKLIKLQNKVESRLIEEGFKE